MDAPETIGRYRIERLLGQGAMGSVYLGIDPELERRVAVKMVRDLDLDDLARKRLLDRFRNEARAAARLSHPSIVQVYDVGEEPTLGPYIVLEFVDGHSLKQLLARRGPLAPSEFISVATQLAEAIDTAHAAGIIHRDIKPDNVLVGEDGRAKLADFGVARVPDAALTREGQFLGTPCYAAPETLSEGRYGPRSDLFSFAAMLYELVTGARAFPGDDAVGVAHAVIHDEPMRPSEAARTELPPGIDDVFARALAKVDEERFASARELAEALEDVFVDAGLVAPSSDRVRVWPIQREPRSSWVGWFWAAILVALGLLAIGFHRLGLLDGGFEPSSEVQSADADVVRVEPPDEEASQVRNGRDEVAPRDAEARDAGRQADAPGDAGLSLPDAGAPLDAARALSPREIEDLAKDELDAARAAIAAGDRRAARGHLERARALDPTSSDLDEVEALLHAMP